MSVVETLRELSEVWQLFGDMPDDTTLGVDLAALYLGISVKTLARYRQNGDGPTYIQYQSEDSKARNQRVNYLLKDLRSWRDSHRVSSTMHAAQVRGLAFTCLSDFTEPQPFWRITNNTGSTSKIISHALTIPDESFKQFLLEPNAEVIWISVEKALFISWINKDERSIWHDIFTSTLNNIVLASGAEQERYILNDIIVDK
ncbi:MULTISPECIES: hypothetical protein [Enterobacteriaceae]|uniref:hypothetical protein n=1 Tax=Enterobacteriaceae TaxID=543 RepID=UPI0003917698|nr:MULTISPECIES: hypothetical protein [Enterobacteriaceae]EBM2003792.1 hypothetical protein [Salmonella enterica]EBU8368355.1 hypothetical protein [Salmonella enterica subsp. enterica serovar Muenchen]ECC9196740.1 hypothetical protein [Salmonella enterica subsp. enterica]EDB4174277.1 hypothetical protein [Salmonella enterica subsp. enterica serovar Poona]EBV3850293.1 hypothetical protein [Salmonella enterica subsp. enterica serovar Muenchen]